MAASDVGYLPTYGSRVITSDLPSEEILRWSLTETVPAPACWSWNKTKQRDVDLSTNKMPPDKANQMLLRGYDCLYETPEELLEEINSARHMKDDVIAHLPEAVAFGEEEIFDKLSIQRRPTPFFAATFEEPPVQDVPSDLRDVMLRVARVFFAAAAKHPKYEPDPIKAMAADRDPLTTSSGYPMYSSDPTDRLLYAAAFGFTSPPKTLSAWETAFGELQRDLGLQPLPWCPVASGYRTGPVTKAVPEWTVRQKGLVADQQVQGKYTRARKVRMESFASNVLMSPLTYNLKLGMFSFPNFYHGIEGMDMYMPWFEEGLWESDLSGYDLTISRQLRAAVADACRMAGFDAMACDVVKLMDEQPALLVPAYDLPGSDDVSYVDREPTGLRSGQKITSAMGTFINWCAFLLYCIRDPEWKFTMDDVLVPRSWPKTVVQSDDMGTSRKYHHVNADLMIAVYSEIGLTIDMMPGSKFLMNHFVHGQRYAVFGRGLQQTISNEHDVGSEGRFLLGMAVRFARPFYGPAQAAAEKWVRGYLQRRANTILRNAAPHDGETLLKWSARVLTSQPVQMFLMSSEGAQWYEDMVQASVYKQSARETLNVLKRMHLALPDSGTAYREALMKAFFGSKTPAEVTSYRTRLRQKLWTGKQRRSL